MAEHLYKLYTVTEAKAAGLDAPYGEDWDDVYDEYQMYLYRHNADGTATFIDVDGGEPEDQTYSRNWGWVVGELNNALKIGASGG